MFLKNSKTKRKFNYTGDSDTSSGLKKRVRAFYSNENETGTLVLLSNASRASPYFSRTFKFKYSNFEIRISNV